jgi:hypothetical protein
VRALNLVKALHLGPDAIVKNSESKNVAVIGAGLAGITAAMGMVCKGHKVRVYDVKSEPLHRQREASHRWLHPTVNFWPDQDGDLTTSTKLPFFEWHQGECKQIIEMLLREWKDYLDKYKNRLSFCKNSKITNVVRTGDQYRLWIKDAPDEDSLVDVVIATAGFKEENSPDLAPTPNYWHPDMLLGKIDDSGSASFTVSGAGDGGLIDALRSLYEFDDGKLAFRFTELLENTDVHENLKKAERQFKKTLKTCKGEIGAFPSQDRDTILDAYRDAVAKFFEIQSCADATDFQLCGSLTKDCSPHSNACRLAHARSLFEDKRKETRSLYLVDNDIDNIALSKAAPIHKFMIALLIKVGNVELVYGSLCQEDGTQKIDPVRGTAFDVPEGSLVYARHGAGTNFEPVLKRSDREVFTEGRVWLSESNVQQHFDDADFFHDTYPAAPSDENERIELRVEISEIALSEMDKGANGASHRTIEHFAEGGDDIQSYSYYGKKLSFGLPNDKIFGVPITYGGEIDGPSKTQLDQAVME